VVVQVPAGSTAVAVGIAGSNSCRTAGVTPSSKSCGAFGGTGVNFSVCSGCL